MTDEPETVEFYTRHCSTPGGVIVVQCLDEEGDETDMAVFTNMAQADEWTGRFGPEVTCIYSPYVINEPDYGNVPVAEQH